MDFEALLALHRQAEQATTAARDSVDRASDAFRRAREALQACAQVEHTLAAAVKAQAPRIVERRSGPTEVGR
jgi:phage-related tail protein